MKPRSQSNPTPGLWYSILLAVSFVSWIPAFSLLFAMSKNRQAGNFGNISRKKRAARGRYGLDWLDGDSPFKETIAAGALGVAIT